MFRYSSNGFYQPCRAEDKVGSETCHEEGDATQSWDHPAGEVFVRGDGVCPEEYTGIDKAEACAGIAGHHEEGM